MIEPTQEEIWRKKSASGTLTIDDIKDIVAYKREMRVSASIASAKAKVATKKKPSAKAIKESEDLLSELDDFELEK